VVFDEFEFFLKLS